MFDPQNKVLYLSVYDAVNGADSVITVNPFMPTNFSQDNYTLRGWGPSGPIRAEPNIMTPESGYCGTALEIQTAFGCNSVKHPRAEGYKDNTTSGGWYTVFRGLALDRSSSLSGVYAVHNMHSATALDPMYKFKIVKYSDLVTGSANGLEPSYNYTSAGIIDALSSNEVTGNVIYKVSPTDLNSTGKIGMLYPNLTLVSETTIQAARLEKLTETCSTCATAHDALKFETAMYAKADGKNYVIFAGAARFEADFTSYPAIFKMNADSADFTDYQEMYLNPNTTDDVVNVASECEGVPDSKQGRFTTFTALTRHGSYGYAGTAGRDENCPDCNNRSACIFMFPLNFKSGERPIRMIALNGELDEKDVWAATVEPDSNLPEGNGGFIYFAVGPRSKTTGRIVKVMIGGTNTDPLCASGCFKRVGTFKESVPFGGVSYVADLHGIVSVSQEDSSITYTKFSTASVTSISPQFVHAETTGALVTITGSGFYSHNYNSDTTSKTHNISCRFGHSSNGFQAQGWSAATFISSTEIRCLVPSASDSLSTNTTYAEVQISFDGFTDNSDATSPYWQGSLWTNDSAVVYYYDAPLITALDVSSSGTFLSKVMLTGEDADNAPVTLKVFGGPFIDSDGTGTGGTTPRLTCRYNGDNTSDIFGTFKSVYEVNCPLCITTMVSGSKRCSTQGTQVSWLTNGTPKSDVDVSISMNGVDFHSSGSQKLHVYGNPYGLRVTHSRMSARAYKANAEPNGTTLKLDAVMVDIVDVQGTTVPIGHTRAFTIRAAVNATASTIGSSSQPNVTLASATQNATVAGTATFDLVLDSVPLVGLYQIYFIGEDCTTNGIPCSPLSATAAFTFTIDAGIATGLTVDPGGTSGSFVTGPEFPTDTIDVTASQSVPIGYVIVNTVDAGGNKLETLDTSNHTVTASVVTTQVVNGNHVPRTTGAVIKGATTSRLSNGFAVFSNLTLDAEAPSGSRSPNSNTDVIYGDPTRGTHGTEAKYLIQFSVDLAASTAVTHTVVRVSVGAAAYLRLNSSTYNVVSNKCIFDPQNNYS